MERKLYLAVKEERRAIRKEISQLYRQLKRTRPSLEKLAEKDGELADIARRQLRRAKARRCA